MPVDAAGLLAEAQVLRVTEAKEHAFPGYQGSPTAAHPVRFASGTGISWAFPWQPPQRSRREVVETLLHPVGAGALQRFVIQEIAPATDRAAEPAFASALRTFRLQP